MHIWRSFALIIISTSIVSAKDDTLRFVTAIWRHGDRAPTRLFPTDTNNGESTWPQGFAELTEIGMKQHQQLGQYLRKRYVDDKGFLSPDYSAKEIYVKASDVNRTIMSALSNMLGMYPLANGREIFEKQAWQPIPLHLQASNEDSSLFTGSPCPNYDDYYLNTVLKSDQAKQIVSDNKDFFDMLQKNTGLKKVALDNIRLSVWDPLLCESVHNNTHVWPNWVTPAIFKNLTALMHLSTTFYYHDPQLQRFRGSLFFNEIASRMDQKAHRPAEVLPAGLKYYVYSLHETLMIALMENMGNYNGILPAYATALLFELHEKQGQFTVEIWYVNQTWPTAATVPVRLRVKDCDTSTLDCTLEKFVSLSNSKTPKDWDAECGLKKPTPSGQSDANDQYNQSMRIAAIVLGILTGVFFILFFATLILYCKAKNKLRNGQRESYNMG